MAALWCYCTKLCVWGSRVLAQAVGLRRKPYVFGRLCNEKTFFLCTGTRIVQNCQLPVLMTRDGYHVTVEEQEKLAFLKNREGEICIRITIIMRISFHKRRNMNEYYADAQ